MPLTFQGDPVNQIVGLAIPAVLSNAVRMQDTGTLKAYVKALDLNAALPPLDLPNTLVINSTKYVPIRCIVYNPTANLSSATLGLYTAAGGGGTAIVAPTLLSSLTGVGTFQSLSIAALTNVITVLGLVPRLTVAAGVAGTASLYLEYVDLSLI